MTEKLYDKDSHLKEFTATVMDSYEMADGFFTILDRTAFFPEGGGQASDIGFINDIKVYDVQIKDGIIFHYTAKPFKKGEVVVGKINWERRFDFMQQHSGEHIVSGVAHSLYGCENVGFHLGADIVTLDFDILLSKEQIKKIEAISNQKIFENKSFSAYYPSAEKLSELTYRSKKELEGDIRIVEIENTDMCACCAPHVNTAGEIGVIKLLSTEKLRGGIRIELKCGRRALNDYNERYYNTSKIGDMLAVKYNETADAVSRLMNINGEHKSTIIYLKKQITDLKVSAFCAETEISAEFEDGLDIKELQIYADALYKKCGGIRGVFSKCEDGYRFAICGNDDKLTKIFTDFKTCFNVRGGGRNGMVQGTVKAEKTDISLFLNTCIC